MEDNIQTVLIFLISAILLFIFPVYVAYEKKDDVSYALVLKYTQDFVEDVGEKGYLTLEDYTKYREKLTITGNMYDIELEHKYSSIIPVVKYYNPDNTFAYSVSQEKHKKTGTPSGLIAKESHETTQEIFATNHINNILNDVKIYTFNEGDVFSVRIKNSNITLATLMYNLVSFDSNNTRIYVSCSETVTDTKWYTQQLQKYSLDKTYDNKARIGIDKFILKPFIDEAGNYNPENPIYFKENYRPTIDTTLNYGTSDNTVYDNYTIEMKVYPKEINRIYTIKEIQQTTYDDLIKNIYTNERYGISVVVGINGIMVFSKGYGVVNKYETILSYKGSITTDTLIEIAIKDTTASLFIDGKRVDYKKIQKGKVKLMMDKTKVAGNFGGPTEEYGTLDYKEMDGKKYKVYPTYIKIYKTE